MKNLFLIIFLVLSSLASLGQSLFFDNITTSAWTSDSALTLAKMGRLKEIGLLKLSLPTDSLRYSRTIWTFRDSLTIRHFDKSTHQEIVIGVFKYKVDDNRGLLTLFFSDNTPLTYEVGISSPGTYATLFQKK